MGIVHISRHVRARSEEVFDLAVRTAQLPTWLALVESVDSDAARLDQVDVEMTTALHLGPRRLTVDWTVTKCDAPRVLHLAGRSGDGGEAEVAFEFGRWDGETEVEIDLEYELPHTLVSSVADRVWIERAVARDLSRSLRELATLVE